MQPIPTNPLLESGSNTVPDQSMASDESSLGDPPELSGESMLTNQSTVEETTDSQWHSEAVRLASFRSWSRCPVIAVDKLARAGLYAVGPNDLVQCFACGIQLGRWRFGDEAARRHREAAPDCPFISGAQDCGNVPLIRAPVVRRQESVASAVRATLTDADEVDFDVTSASSDIDEADEAPGHSNESVQVRLRSFRHWPKEAIVSGASLANAGFMFTGRGDTTQCVACGGRLQQWQRGDDPVREHQAHFPLCALARGLAASPTASGAAAAGPVNRVSVPLPGSPSGEETEGNRMLRQLGIFSSRPKYECLATLDARLRTFQGWPASAAQRPLQLASAGFFYTGNEDRVKCFHCDGGLHNWLPQDSVYREHARWFSGCDYLRLLKGADYIADAQKEVGARRRVPTEQSRGVMDLAALKDAGLDTGSEAIRSALEMGFAETAIAEAIVANNWRPFATAEGLIDAITATTSKVASEASVEEEVKEESVLEPRAANPESELAYLLEQRRCKICLDGEASVVFLPCGHVTACPTCAPPLLDCPICRQPIQGRLRAYFA